MREALQKVMTELGRRYPLVIGELAYPADLLSVTRPELDITYTGKLLEASGSTPGMLIEWETCRTNECDVGKKVAFVVSVIQQSDSQKSSVFRQRCHRFVLPELRLDRSYSCHTDSSKFLRRPAVTVPNGSDA